jgi:pSer/pThr/pTyr-binding forkhead associated (FHA) protein
MDNIPKLVVLSEKFRGQTFDLNQDLYTCGRSEARDICFKDSTVSSHHADFFRIEDGEGYKYFIRDNHSTNGTRVNNVPIKQQELHNTDIVQVGGIEILFDGGDKTGSSASRTQTGIDIANTDSGLATVKTMSNLSPFVGSRKKGSSQKILLGVVIVLGLFILALIVYIIFLVLSKSGEDAPAALLNMFF